MVKQEKLKEAAEREYRFEADPAFPDEIEHEEFLRIFKKGAKWQQERMYNEKDLREAILTSFLLGVDRGNYSKEVEDKLIEQFKKK